MGGGRGGGHNGGGQHRVGTIFTPTGTKRDGRGGVRVWGLGGWGNFGGGRPGVIPNLIFGEKKRWIYAEAHGLLARLSVGRGGKMADGKKDRDGGTRFIDRAKKQPRFPGAGGHFMGGLAPN